jgi:hypothetical protein
VVHCRKLATAVLVLGYMGMSAIPCLRIKGKIGDFGETRNGTIWEMNATAALSHGPVVLRVSRTLAGMHSWARHSSQAATCPT